MNPNHIVSSCFNALQACHLSMPVDVPRSPSSVILLDDIHQKSNTMLTVTEQWFLEDGVLSPTKQHIRDYCKRVASLFYGDRIVCFICRSRESNESYSISVHLSRIKTHGGKLMRFVTPYLSRSSNQCLEVPVQESVLGMLTISDYLYRSHIDLTGADLSDTIEIASAAWKWECHDLFVGSLFHIVSEQLLGKKFSVVELLHWSYFTHKVRIRNQVLSFTAMHDCVRTCTDARLLLIFYRARPIPTAFKKYFALAMARFFFHLFPEQSTFDEANPSRACTGTIGQREAGPSSFVDFTKRDLIGLLHRNNILYETLQSINRNRSRDYDARNIFWTLLHHAESMIDDNGKVIFLVQRACAETNDPEMLVSDDDAWTRLTPRGMKIVALALSNRQKYCTSIQFSIHIPWDSVKTGSSRRDGVGSIAGVKFELKARSTGTRSCSWRLYFCSVEGSCHSDSVYARISYELFNSKCFCEDIHVMERCAKVKLEDRSFQNGSVKDMHTEGEVTILSEAESEEWCSRHLESCVLSISVRIELCLF